MKQVLVKSVHAAFEYVMDHYCPAGQEEPALRTDSYVVISIQDTVNGGFGLRFCENAFCKGVLTLCFDDVVRPVDGAVLFTEEHARQIIEFVSAHRDADTLLVHCYAGQSRSRAVAAFCIKLLTGKESRRIKSGNYNEHVYAILESVWAQYGSEPG